MTRDRTPTVRAAAGVAAVLAAGLVLAACSGEPAARDHRADGAPARSTTLPVGRQPTTTVADAHDLGLTVTGGFGRPPKVKAPTGRPPTALTRQVLAPGAGARVAPGTVLIAHYQLRTWGTAEHRPVLVDDTYTAGMPIAVTVGAGQVLGGWDRALVGQRVGARVLVALPAEARSPGAGATVRPAPPGAAGSAMVAVVDILAAMPPDTAATGTEVAVTDRKGLPAVTSRTGRRPEVTSTPGVDPTRALSRLLLRGRGPRLEPRRTLILQMIQVDAATGQTTQQTWGGTPVLVRTDQLVPTVRALRGARVGSRALAVVPAAGTGHAQLLVVDVIAQV